MHDHAALDAAIDRALFVLAEIVAETGAKQRADPRQVFRGVAARAVRCLAVADPTEMLAMGEQPFGHLLDWHHLVEFEQLPPGQRLVHDHLVVLDDADGYQRVGPLGEPAGEVAQHGDRLGQPVGQAAQAAVRRDAPVQLGDVGALAVVVGDLLAGQYRLGDRDQVFVAVYDVRGDLFRGPPAVDRRVEPARRHLVDEVGIGVHARIR